MIDFDIFFHRFIVDPGFRMGAGVDFQHIYHDEKHKNKCDHQAYDFYIARLADPAAEAQLLDYGIRVLAHYDNGFRCVTNSKGPVESPDDMKGMLIRTPENQVIMATMSALGANPQPLAFSELYQALQQKTYDAQENPIPVIYNNKLYEVQEYLSVTNHIYSGMCFAIAESAWQKLTPEQQEIVAEAALASGAYDRQMNRQQTDDLVANLEEAGMKINYPDLAPFSAASKTVIEENALGISEDLLAALA